MRKTATRGGLHVRAIAGTHTVLLGFDLNQPVGCLGFAIRRVDHTEQETYWLRGMKTFASVEPHPSPGQDYSTRDQPIQGFQWGDYTAKADHSYTYTVVALAGTPAALTETRAVSVKVHTEQEDDGHHGIWFNRGIAGSQAYARKFPGYVPPVDGSEDDAAFAWLSRGLGEAFTAFCAQATDSRWGLRGAFYEFTWMKGLAALAAARDRGADVRLVIHGRDKDAPAGPDADQTTAASRKQATAAGLDDGRSITWRTAASKNALQHNKFLVLTHDGIPVALWTGSMNITRGAVYGHSNVGHAIRDMAVAGQFLAYWNRLVLDTETTTSLRVWDETNNPVAATVPVANGTTTVFSPRAASSTLLDWYANLFDSAIASAHITGAFGINAAIRAKLTVTRPGVLRTVLLDKDPPPGQEIPRTDSHVRVSTGALLTHGFLEQWAAEKLTGFNPMVKFIHTKIILVDPLGPTPTIMTGSANYSSNSTTDNEENTVIIHCPTGNTTAARQVRRVADIYLTEYHRLFMHFVYRRWANSLPTTPDMHLEETDSWTTAYYIAGSWKADQRRFFAGT
jgi:phosphatidylserine/phosphatidylglycerophosphate/cardiolipin synthase-like enzyme